RVNAEGLADAATIDALQKAILNLSKQKIGALIVFEQKTGLRDVMESGIELDARISTELVENIFYPKAPLHDGAMIVRKGMIAAAGCFLPISDNKSLPSELGTRHRAALGISEVSDCIVIVVSEETGMISCAEEGVLRRPLDIKALRETLDGIFAGTENSSRSIDRLNFKWGGSK
ncbi:MAG: DNA integrity scanning protein DisA nucleotide-binding domain protein, partial [Christensenellaceae bacterium]|nr:DNA integrity scanning protein DisA nucleotide-binding domain protein [Christensenellaceae bacterium]